MNPVQVTAVAETPRPPARRPPIVARRCATRGPETGSRKRDRRCPQRRPAQAAEGAGLVRLSAPHRASRAGNRRARPGETQRLNESV
jgi:hypothetical protein